MGNHEQAYVGTVRAATGCSSTNSRAATDSSSSDSVATKKRFQRGGSTRAVGSNSNLRASYSARAVWWQWAIWATITNRSKRTVAVWHQYCRKPALSPFHPAMLIQLFAATLWGCLLLTGLI